MNSLNRIARLGVFSALLFSACGSPSDSTVITDLDMSSVDSGERRDMGVVVDADVQDADAMLDRGIPGIVVTPVDHLITTEAGGAATFSVALNSEPTANVSITLYSSDETEGTIIPSVLEFSTLTWGAPQTVTIMGVDDSERDHDQAYTIELSPAVTTDTDYNGMLGDNVSVVNVDDESAGVTVSPVTGLTTTESGGTATFTVVLNSAPSADVMIAVASDNSAEGTASPASLNFTSENWATPQIVTIVGVDDFAEDGAVGYHITFMPPSSADEEYAAIESIASVSVTNTDNDTAGITVTPTTGLTTSEVGGTATFTVVLNSLPTADVVIPLSTDDATEGAISPDSLTFTAENWNAPQTVTLTGLDDDLADGSVLYYAVTGAAVSDDPNFADIDAANVSVRNIDNDTAGLTVTPLTGLRTSEAGGTATFTVALNAMPVSDTTINVTSTNTAEGTVSPATLTFTAINWNAPQTVTITGVDDLAGDGPTNYTVRVVPASGGDPAYTASMLRIVQVQNIDNDTPGITITGGPLHTTEAGGSDSISVVLNTAPSTDVFILITLDDPTEATLSTAILRFTPTNWASPQTIRVNGLDDTDNDGDQPFHVGIGPSSSADIGYDNPDPQYIDGTNADDEQPGITVTPPASPVTTELGGSFTFSVHLNTIPRGAVNLGISASLNGDEVSFSPTSLHFEPDGINAWNVNQLVTVRGLADGIVDGDQVVNVRTAVTTSEDADYMAIAGTPSAVTFSATNRDYDVNRIFVSPTSGLQTSEDGREDYFYISVSAAPSADVTINCHSTNEAEGLVLTPTVVINASNWSSPQRVTVVGVDDASEDGNAIYSVQCDPSISTQFAYNNIDPDDVTVTNLDNEEATATSGIQFFPTKNLVTSERGHEAHVEVVLSAAPRGRVSIPVSIEGESALEGRVIVSSLEFDERNWDQPQVLRIIGVDDTERDGNREYSVTIGKVESEDPAYSGIDPEDLYVINNDDERGAAGIEVNPVTGLHTSEWGDVARFAVVLSAPPEGTIAYAVYLDNEREAKLLVDHVEFNAENWFIPQVVSVVGQDDSEEDGDVGYHVTFKATTIEDRNYEGIAISDVSITNWDDERGTAGVVVSDLYNTRTTEEGREVSFYVSLRSMPRGRVHLRMYNADDSEAKLLVTELDFDERNWHDRQAVTLLGTDDGEEDGDVQFYIVLSELESDDDAYNRLDPQDVLVTNEDAYRDAKFAILNDARSPIEVAEGERGGEFSIWLSQAPEADVCVRVLSDDWTESYTDVAWACFTRENYRDPQRITVYGIQDYADDGDAYSNIRIGPAITDDPNFRFLEGHAPWILTRGR